MTEEARKFIRENTHRLENPLGLNGMSIMELLMNGGRRLAQLKISGFYVGKSNVLNIEVPNCTNF